MNDEPKNFRRQFGGRLMRWSFFSVVVFVTLIALFYAEEDWRGKRAWEHCKRDLQAKGIVLDWDKYIPPPVPDDQNIFAAPKMQEWFVGRSTNELTELLQSPKKFPVWGSGKTIDTEADARAYLGWSDRLQPQFDLIRDALKRPYSRMDGDYAHPLTMPIPNFLAMRQVARTLVQRAHCHFLLHQPDKALEDLTLVHDLCRLAQGAPGGKPMTLVAAMINVAVTGLYVDGLADGFKLHAWQEPKIAAVQEQLKDIHLMPFVAEAFRDEFAAVNHTFETMSLEKVASPLQEKHAHLFSLTPRGWANQNLVNLAGAYQMPLESFDPAHDVISPHVCNEAEHRLETFLSRKSPFKILAAIAVPNFRKATETTARNQNLANEAMVVCALERYLAVHSEYPESLDALMPDFLDKLPHDIIDGGELKYRRTNNRFVLYSTGWNEKDDGGISAFTKDGARDWDNGDWVWATSAK
jgi:hypothetical protein